MEKILVIGSNSFSGSTFSSFAIKNNFEVIGVSRSNELNRVFLPYKWSNKKNFEFNKIDINSQQDKLFDLIQSKKPEFIVNFAAQGMVAQSWDTPEDWFMTNTLSTIKLFNKLKDIKFISKYIHISTPEVYGSVSGFIEENFNFNPSTPYAVSRASADMLLKIYINEFKFPAIITRAANVYGAGQQLYRIIPRTIIYLLMGKKLKLHGAGTSSRSFIHMDDVSDATLKILLKGSIGESYHISTNKVLSIKSLVELICKKLDKSFEESVDIIEERMGKDQDYHLNSDKLRNELKWNDSISLDKGIDACIEWIKTNYDMLKHQELEYVHKR